MARYEIHRKPSRYGEQGFDYTIWKFASDGASAQINVGGTYRWYTENEARSALARYKYENVGAVVHSEEF